MEKTKNTIFSVIQHKCKLCLTGQVVRDTFNNTTPSIPNMWVYCAYCKNSSNGDVSIIFTADILGVTAPERNKTIITIKDVQ
jgi:hypothetical protein